MKVQRFDLIYNGANLMKVDSKDGNFIPVSTLSERDKLIDEMLDCIRKIHTYDYYQDFYHRVEAMRSK